MHQKTEVDLDLDGTKRTLDIAYHHLEALQRKTNLEDWWDNGEMNLKTASDGTSRQIWKEHAEAFDKPPDTPACELHSDDDCYQLYLFLSFE